MKSCFAFLLVFSLWIADAHAFKMKSGDLILQPTACYLCNLIEAEEKTPYSHMGVLVLNQGEWNVLEAWGKVKSTPLAEFLSRREKNTQSLILRANRKLLKHRLQSASMLERFTRDFEGLSYDSQFLWDNQDQAGEKLYCSEFVSKFLRPFLTQELPTKPMHFEMNREHWIKYFHGNPPDGAPGNSPGDFERSPLFHQVGML